MKAYIAGPMTGRKDLNFPAFHAEAKKWRDLGHEIINPAELNPDPTMPWAECMRRDIAAPSDRFHLIRLCNHANGDGWASAHRQEERDWIADKEGLR